MGWLIQMLAAVAVTAAAAPGAQPAHRNLAGSVKIDGSSTVYPITEAVAEEFHALAPRVRVTVGISGTGGGFKRFAQGEIDIADASRPIKKSEVDQCATGRVEFIELPVAYDGLSIVVNRGNDFVDHLTVDEVQAIFLDDGDYARTWKDLRPAWPDEPIRIYSPGTDSGTFDYFKEVVAGDDGAIRGDMSVSEDDNVLVRGVAGDRNAIGFFGVAYYMENQDQLRVVPIVNPETGRPVSPTPEAIEGGDYAPFSRPLFIYANKKSAARPEVRAFVEFYLEHAADLAGEVGYVALPESVYEAARRSLREGRAGTRFLDGHGEKVHGPVTEVYR